ncbi:MAG: MmgE/PrpD family protein [Chloroflexota bacterium]|nr:MAG: MmgE/PrpD family protein [Chloroflexota bacterium]
MSQNTANADLTLVQALSGFVADVTFERLPQEVSASVKQRVLDTIGICLAASADRLADGVGDVIELWGGREQSSVVLRPGRFPAPSAALFNGTLAHSLDFDDTHLPSVLHPSASVVPAALAMGEALSCSGQDVIAAAAAGYEVCIRTGMAGYDPKLGNSVFFERGWHATSICGALAAAALGAKLLGLGPEGIAHAMGIAASMSSGLIESNRAGGSVKRLHCGWAAHSGLTAALLAERGYTGPSTVFEGRFGFYAAYCDGQFDPIQITEGLGERWCAPDIFFKPYPANHFTHAMIDAALALKRKFAVDVETIEEIELGAASAPLRTIGEPREQKIRPQSGYHAQFSGPFAVATALLGGSGLGVSFGDFTDEKVKDPAFLALAAKVRTFVDAECERVFPNQFPAIVRLRLRSGEVLEERVMANRGGPDNPLSDDELLLKFRLNAERSVAPAQAERIAAAIMSMQRLERVGDILALARD